ncbi:response regulator [Brevundimonas sp. PAMC22021]|nr:response regulator [Brevundimonas sp. PAMC22021]
MEHDWRVTLLAGLVCLTGIATAFHLMERARIRRGIVRRNKIVLAALVGALAIWATHFIAMQGYAAGAAMTFEPWMTMASLLVALIGIGVGIVMAMAGNRPLTRCIAASTGVASIAAMHYLGMAAMNLPFEVTWDLGLVATSVVAAMIIGAGSAACYRRNDHLRFWITTLGAVLSVIVLHFTGMAALTLGAPQPMPNREGLDPASMQMIMAGAVLFVIAVVLIRSWTTFSARSGALRQIREAVDAMPDGLAFFDSEDRLVLWNARFVEVNPEIADHLKVGMTGREILQLGLDRHIYPDALGREAEWAAERMTHRARLSAILEQQVADGRWLRVQHRSTAEGGIVTVCNDITDLKNNARILAEARDAAEAANHAKSLFLANMSHEIRTPLNGVVGLAQVLAGSDLSREQREMVDLIQSSGATLQALLGDILDLARVESGRLELDEQPFNLPELVQEAAHLYAANAREKRLGFQLDIAPEAAVWVRGDAVRIKQVLTNLISNAVKFTENGFVAVRVERTADRDDGAAALRFTVEDTGIGFDADARERMFSRFEQADSGITRRYGGSGLGLAICRQLADLMGGRLDCESEPGGGSAFIFTLCLHQAEAPRASEPAAYSEANASLSRRVLVADDHPTNRRVVELILAQAGVELTSVENGAEAVAAARACDFDLILMDMQMPVMDGLTAVREIRLHEAALGLPRTPLVMLTANAMPEHVAAGQAAGADGHLAKPFNAAELLTLVEDPQALLIEQRVAA